MTDTAVAWQLLQQAGLRFLRQDLRRAARAGAAALSAFRALGENEGVAQCSMFCGAVHEQLADLDKAVLHYLEAAEAGRVLGRDEYAASCEAQAGELLLS